MKKFILFTVILTMILSVCGCSSNQGKNHSYESEIDKDKVMTFEIKVHEEEWQNMLDNAINEEYISADITINGTTIENVGIRPKGNSSLTTIANDDTTDRYSFKIKFDEYVDGQTWKGLDKIVVNNMISDSTYLKEYLSYDIMRYIGVKTPLFAFADISVNGETWGFYLAIEDMDSSYIDRVYNGEGELYKPDNDMGGQAMGNMENFPQKMPDNLNGLNENNSDNTTSNNIENNANNTTKNSDTNNNDTTNNGGFPGFGANGPDKRGGFGGGMSGMAENGVSLKYTDDNIESYSAIFENGKTKTDENDHKRVITALKNLNEGKNLETYVDVDSVLRYFAAHTVVVNLDSYVSTMGHNYYLYENDGKINILPWDYNLAFGGFQSGNATDVVNFPIDTPVSGINMEERPLLNKLLEVEEYKEKYHSYLQEIVDGYFKDGKWESKIASLHDLIKDYVKNDPSAFYTYEEYEAGVVALKELGKLRADSIQGQLDGTIPSTTEGQQSDSSALIDASSIDLSTLGTQGGSKGMPGNFNLPDGLTMENIISAKQIMGNSTFEELTQEQLEKLHELGLTEEQIEQLANFQFPNMPGGNGVMPQGNPPNTDGKNKTLPQGSSPNTDSQNKALPQGSLSNTDSQNGVMPQSNSSSTND